MSASDELRDPWGWLVAGFSGGLGWAVLAGAGALAVAPAAAVGVGIAGAVLGTKVALGSRDREPRKERRLPQPPRGSEQALLLRRAAAALERVTVLADSTADEWTAARVVGLDADAHVVQERLEELAGRVTVADNSLASARPDLLAADRARVSAELHRESDPDLHAARAANLEAIDTQIAAVDRIGRLRERLLARMNTTVLGLDGLAARMGELVALGAKIPTDLEILLKFFKSQHIIGLCRFIQ